MAPSTEYPLARDELALRWNDVDIGYPELTALADAAWSVVDGLPGSGPVGVLGRKSPVTIAVVLACLRSGRPFLLPPPDLGADVRAELLRVAGCGHVLRVEADGTAVEPVDGAVDRSDLAGVGFMLTTSGSTGVPKVVPLPRDAVAAFTDWAAAHFGIGPGTAVFNYAPLNFDLCLLDVWTTLAHGGRSVLVDPDRALDAKYLLRTFEGAGVEVVQGVPMLYRLLLDAAGGRAFPEVREVVCTGEAMPSALLAELPRLFPNARLHNVYGCTETNDSFIHEIDPAQGVPVPIGRPIGGTTALLLADDGTVVTGAGTGELLVSTPFQAGRYLDPALTARAWTPGPPGAPDGWYFRSGDRVRRDQDGVLRLVGRTDFQVKVRGVRTNLQEIERVMLDHPGVTDAVVLAVPDDTTGNRLHAIVRRTPGQALNSLGLRRHCAANLPRTAIPSDLDITDDEFPRTSTGKVDRKMLTKGVRLRAATH
ncbi:MAG: AMP-binding protein [Umezawaea sp.]